MPTTDKLDERMDDISADLQACKVSLFGLGDDIGRLGRVEMKARTMEDRMRIMEDSKLVAVSWMAGAVALATLAAQFLLAALK